MRRRLWAAAAIVALVSVGLGVGPAPLASAAAEDVTSYPPDLNEYTRPKADFDENPQLGGAHTPGLFLRNVIVSNTDPTLTNTDTFNDGEPSIAINPADPHEIVVLGFSGSWSGGNNAPLFHSTDGGLTWTKRFTIPPPPGWDLGCPCDQTPDFRTDGTLDITFLSTLGGILRIVSGSTTDPTNAAAWQWNGNPVQFTDFNATGTSSDQPWLLTNRDPVNAAQQNTYVTYDDFGAAPGTVRTSASYGVTPLNFTADNQSGTQDAAQTCNPGARMADDRTTGTMYVLHNTCNNAGVAGRDHNTTYRLNRSTDGGATWTLNANPNGVVVAGPVLTRQLLFKHGGVNALRGGIDHAAANPTTGEVYYVYGEDLLADDTNQLLIKRIGFDVVGNAIVPAVGTLVTNDNAALPQVAVLDDGTLFVGYYTHDGFSNGFPVFSVKLARSTDGGATFTTQTLLQFVAQAQDNGVFNQRIFGDYWQMKALGNTLYGAFTANGAALGRPFANGDPIFFQLGVGPSVRLTGVPLEFGNVAVNPVGGEPGFNDEQFGVLNGGNQTLDVLSISCTAGNCTDFTLLPNPALPLQLAPNDHADFTVRFDPTVAGARAATFTVTTNDPINPNITFLANGFGATPDIEVSGPIGQQWQDVCVGDAEVRTFSIFNNGTSNLRIDEINLPNTTDFSMSGAGGAFLPPIDPANPIFLPPGEHLDIQLTFHPQTVSPATKSTGNITVDSNDPVTPSFAIGPYSGTVGVGLILISPNPLSFGNVPTNPVGGEIGVKDLPLTLHNQGTCDLQIQSLSAVAGNTADFAVLPTNPTFPITLSADSDFQVNVRFDPTAAGLRAATLRAVSDSGQNPGTFATNTDVTVNGVGTVPDISVSGSLSFGRVRKGFSDRVIEIANQGNSNLRITNIFLTGNSSFSLQGLPNLPLILSPDSHRLITVRCQPTKGNPKIKTATLTIQSNDPDEPTVNIPATCRR